MLPLGLPAPRGGSYPAKSANVQSRPDGRADFSAVDRVLPRRGRPPRFVARERRGRFLELVAGGLSLEAAMRETGLSPRTVIRILDDPGWPATIEAVRATLAAEAG